MALCASRGFSVCGIDLSANMVATARKKCPAARVSVAALTCFSLAEKADACIASHSLIHLSKSEVPAALARIYENLKPSGFLYASVHIGKSWEGLMDEPFDPSLKIFLNVFSEEEWTDLLNAAGFNILKAQNVLPKIPQQFSYGKSIVFAQKKKKEKLCVDPLTLDVNAKTLAAYTAHAAAYNAKSPAEPLLRVRAWLWDAIKGLPQSARLFEIGSGPGREALYLRRLGFDVVCSDAAEPFVAQLRALGFPAQRFDVRTDACIGPWDLVFANAVLLHLTVPDVIRAFHRIARSLRENGRFALTLKEGQGDFWESEKIGAPRYFHFWQKADLEKALSEAGFGLLSLETTAQPETGETWIAAVAVKR